MKKKYGLLGRSISYSLSPIMHNAAFKETGVNAEYFIFDIPEEDVEHFLMSCKENGIFGFNVTIPYKIKVLNILKVSGTLDESAKRLEAVNTVVLKENGDLSGFNTDGPGFLAALKEDLSFSPLEKSIFIIGAGGAATAILLAMAKNRDNKPKKITILDIDSAKSTSLCKKINDSCGTIACAVPKEEFESNLARADLLVNASPAGSSENDPLPVSLQNLGSEALVYDLIYYKETELVRKAKKMGIRASNGLGMLLHQAAYAFQIWTGRQPPLAKMKEVLIGELEAKFRGH